MNTFASFSDRELLEEIDRRQRAARPPVVHFFGVWPGQSAGHYQRSATGLLLEGRDGCDGRVAGLYPWVYWKGDPAPQSEGLLWSWRHPTQPLTLLLSWDRSADQRGGCCATFIVHAHVTDEYALELARAAFPAVFARIETYLGKAMVLAGPVPD